MFEKTKDFLAAVDLIAARLRVVLNGLFAIGAAFQVAIASGAYKVPEGSKWASWIAAGSIVLAWYTVRGKGEVAALVEARRLEGEPPMPGQKNPPPTFPPTTTTGPVDPPKG